MHGLSNTLSQPTSSLLSETRRLLQRLGLRARKGLGQHFLVDSRVLGKVVDAAALTPEDTVIEVGPGLGVLTRELAQRVGRVIAIELDDNLAASLKERLPSPNLTIVNGNVLHYEPSGVVGDAKYKVVANLPYNITSPVLRHFLEASARPELIVVMVQKEVARAIAAGQGERSLLSIGIQFYGKPSIIGYVPASAFFPPPEVDSAILRIDVYPHPPIDVGDVKGFFALVRAGFAAPRKHLANSLAQGLGVERGKVQTMLAKAGIDPTHRAETLTLEEWGELWKASDA